MSTALETAVSTPPEKPALNLRVNWWKLGILLALLALCYYDVVGKLVRDWWMDADSSHGFIVPLFSGYLLWQRRQKLARLPVKPSWVGIFVIAGGLMTLVVGTLGAELFLSRSSLLLVLAGIVIQLFGWRHFREVAFPWAFLFLMIPPPAIIFNQITFSLQLLASHLAKDLLNLVGVPVLLEGNILRLPAMPLEVAEACSGIRSLMSLGVLSIIYGCLLEPTIVGRVILAIAAIPLAVAANATRIVGTGLMVQYWDPERALGFFHEFSGWVIFMIALMLLLGLHGIMRTGITAFKSAWKGRPV